jgi:hypothetical protein
MLSICSPGVPRGPINRTPRIFMAWYFIFKDAFDGGDIVSVVFRCYSRSELSCKVCKPISIWRPCWTTTLKYWRMRQDRITLLAIQGRNINRKPFFSITILRQHSTIRRPSRAAAFFRFRDLPYRILIQIENIYLGWWTECFASLNECYLIIGW